MLKKRLRDAYEKGYDKAYNTGQSSVATSIWKNGHVPGVRKKKHVLDVLFEISKHKCYTIPIYIYIYIINTDVPICIQTCMYICVYVYISTCIYIYICIYESICTA